MPYPVPTNYHKSQYSATLALIKGCGYGNGYKSIFDYTAYGWSQENVDTDCPDDSFVYPDYEDDEILAMMN